jgi:hypothetical protein
MLDVRCVEETPQYFDTLYVQSTHLTTQVKKCTMFKSIELANANTLYGQLYTSYILHRTSNILFALAYTDNDDKEMKKNKRNLDIQVVLGNPKIDCDGYGICKIMMGHKDVKDTTTRNSPINAILNIKEQVATVVFKKAQMPSKVFEKQCATGIFTIDTPLRLPNSISQYFQIPPSVFVSGKYPIYLVKQTIVMRILLEEDKLSELKSESESVCLTCKH